VKVACPTCGAEVDFRYDDTFVRVCGSCRAAVVRGDRGAESLGQVADLAPTASPLKLFADGTWRGQGFMLVGRAQFKHPAGGVWDEWYAKLDDGTWGWLAEAQGRFYLTFETVGAGEPPPWDEVFPGASIQLHDDGPHLYTVGERGVAELAGAEGEIPFRFVPGSKSAFADLADGTGRFATIDYGDPDDDHDPHHVYMGRQVTLAELRVAGGEVAPAARASAGKRLACPTCNGSIELRAPDQSMRVACPYCATLLSCEGDLAIVGKLAKRQAPDAIALGSQGTFDGVTYTVIGCLRRQAGADLEELSLFTWDEYLLYEPSVGFRWLVESGGHWTFVTTVPPGAAHDEGSTAKYDDTSFRLFDRGVATVIGVWGEMYWRVEAGEVVKTADFVAPPAMLSSEESGSELNWSLGVYRTRAEIERAFGGKAKLASPTGVGAAQPFRHRHAWKTFALLLVLLGALTVVRGVMARNVLVFAANPPIEPPPAEALAELPPGSGDQRLVFTDSFELGARRNVMIRIGAAVDNSWIYVAGDLVNEATGELQTFTGEVSYYHGFEGGESWSEGGRSRTFYLGAVKPGRYLIRLEVLQPSAGAIDRLELEVRQNVFRFLHVLMALLVIGVPGLLLVLWQWWFERRRWSNSDYAPSGLKSGGDDD
jgi:Domain of unknown function (DUF4178)